MRRYSISLENRWVVQSPKMPAKALDAAMVNVKIARIRLFIVVLISTFDKISFSRVFSRHRQLFFKKKLAFFNLIS